MSGGRHLPGGKITQMRQKEWAIVKSWWDSGWQVLGPEASLSIRFRSLTGEWTSSKLLHSSRKYVS
jgi:hypothetical protein